MSSEEGICRSRGFSLVLAMRCSPGEGAQVSKEQAEEVKAPPGRSTMNVGAHEGEQIPYSSLQSCTLLPGTSCTPPGLTLPRCVCCLSLSRNWV